MGWSYCKSEKTIGCRSWLQHDSSSLGFGEEGISLAVECVEGILGFGVTKEKATRDWTDFYKSQGSKSLFAYRKCCE
ncbi:hypothetical protein MRB53_015957 [Persea americana]|uniref:Uncharacterized protein n=1 Tax=Persea americana TaxID=3435 RepID=A0ACC2M0U0_PERAE|nr:hypothetical protein MRB53_015957 [Persea americana]